MKRNIIIIICNVALLLPAFGQSLEEYQRIAAENNPGLMSAYKDFEASMQRIPQVALADPTLSFGYFLSPVETRVGPQRFKLSLSQMFPWFGTLQAREDAAARLAEATYQQFLDARNNIWYQVAASWYPIYETNRWIALEEENLAIIRSFEDVATVNFQNGEGSMVDVLQAEIRRETSLANLEIYRDKLKAQVVIFNNLLNRADTAMVKVPDTLLMTEAQEMLWRDSLLVNNPSLTALQLRQQAAMATETVAQKEGMPRIGLGLDYVAVAKNANSTVPDNGKDVVMPMATITIPVFRKKYDAGIREAQLRQESIGSSLENKRNELLTAFENAWFSLQKEKRQLALYSKNIEITEQALNLLYSSYGTAGNDFEELLRTQQQLLQFRKKHAGSLAAYHTAVAKIKYLTAITEPSFINE